MIKDKKKLPTALAEKQELQRQKTINKVYGLVPIYRQRARNAELEQECELLRGRLFLMMESGERRQK